MMPPVVTWRKKRSPRSSKRISFLWKQRKSKILSRWWNRRKIVGYSFDLIVWNIHERKLPRMICWSRNIFHFRFLFPYLIEKSLLKMDLQPIRQFDYLQRTLSIILSNSSDMSEQLESLIDELIKENKQINKSPKVNTHFSVEFSLFFSVLEFTGIFLIGFENWSTNEIEFSSTITSSFLFRIISLSFVFLSIEKTIRSIDYQC